MKATTFPLFFSQRTCHNYLRDRFEVPKLLNEEDEHTMKFRQIAVAK